MRSVPRRSRAPQGFLGFVAGAEQSAPPISIAKISPKYDQKISAIENLGRTISVVWLVWRRFKYGYLAFSPQLTRVPIPPNNNAAERRFFLGVRGSVSSR